MKADVYWVPGPWPGRLGIVPRPRGGDWLADEVRAWREAGLQVVASLLTPGEVAELELRDEERRCLEQGLEFHGLPIPDRGVPASRKAWRHLIGQIEQALAAGKSVAAHCRQGIGRASMIVASVLVDTGESAADAFRKIEEARGRPVPDTAEQRDWVASLAGGEPRELGQSSAVP